MTLDSMRHLTIGVVIGVVLTTPYRGSRPDTPSSATHIVADSVIQVHLATYEVTMAGVRIASSPVQRALMEFDCRSNRYRRLGADVERPNGNVAILDGQQAGYDWRTVRTNDPEFLQIRASCDAR